MSNSKSDHKFKVGDMAMLGITFDVIEKHRGEPFVGDDDVLSFVRGDVVDILDIRHHKDGRKIAVIYNIVNHGATTILLEHLRPTKGTVYIGGPDMEIKGGIINAGHLSGSKKISF